MANAKRTFRWELVSRRAHPSYGHLVSSSPTDSQKNTNQRELQLTRSMLENSNFPFFITTSMNPLGNSPPADSRSDFFKVNMKPVSWYKSESGKLYSLESLQLSWKMSLMFSLYVSRATSSKGLQFAYRQINWELNWLINSTNLPEWRTLWRLRLRYHPDKKVRSASVA